VRIAVLAMYGAVADAAAWHPGHPYLTCSCRCSLASCCWCCCCPIHQVDEDLREGKLRFRGGRGEAATYDGGDEVRMHLICLCSSAVQTDRQSACRQAVGIVPTVFVPMVLAVLLLALGGMFIAAVQCTQ
jgi:hypothetical protein